MSNHELNEDAIDLQELQAQIDLSMSFAQNLVTSWVKPTHSAQPTKQNDLENELKEYMRRPARLGVGAPIPETQSLAREGTRLKSKLEGGKKRHREETMEIRQPQPESEEESRGGAIKKKARLDPFSMVTKKKKKNIEADGKNIPALHPAAFEALSRIHSDSIGEDVSVNGLAGFSEPSKTHKKKKRRHSSHDKEPTKQAWASEAEAALPNNEITSTGPKLSQNAGSPKAMGAPGTPTFTPASLASSPPTSPTVTRPKFVDISLTTTPVVSPGHPIPDPRFLDQPLLNLAGRPSGGESDEDENPGQSDLTPKKKRKRKKKRKKQSVETEATKA